MIDLASVKLLSEKQRALVYNQALKDAKTRFGDEPDPLHFLKKQYRAYPAWLISLVVFVALVVRACCLHWHSV